MSWKIDGGGYCKPADKKYLSIYFSSKQGREDQVNYATKKVWNALHFITTSLKK